LPRLLLPLLVLPQMANFVRAEELLEELRDKSFDAAKVTKLTWFYDMQGSVREHLAGFCCSWHAGCFGCVDGALRARAFAAANPGKRLLLNHSAEDKVTQALKNPLLLRSLLLLLLFFAG
jgi:hypothetical protein